MECVEWKITFDPLVVVGCRMVVLCMIHCASNILGCFTVGTNTIRSGSFSGGRKVGESKDRQTHTTGEVYTHPRDRKYKERFDTIFGERCIKCRKGLEDCVCQESST